MYEKLRGVVTERRKPYVVVTPRGHHFDTSYNTMTQAHVQLLVTALRSMHDPGVCRDLCDANVFWVSENATIINDFSHARPTRRIQLANPDPVRYVQARKYFAHAWACHRRVTARRTVSAWLHRFHVGSTRRTRRSHVTLSRFRKQTFRGTMVSVHDSRRHRVEGLFASSRDRDLCPVTVARRALHRGARSGTGCCHAFKLRIRAPSHATRSRTRNRTRCHSWNGASFSCRTSRCSNGTCRPRCFRVHSTARRSLRTLRTHCVPQGT